MAADWSTAALVRGLRAYVLNLAESVGRITALGNDVAFKEIFAEQLVATGQEGDVLVLVSVSGSSPNLVRAAECARTLGMTVVGVLGRKGAVAEHCSSSVILGDADYGLTEDLHLSVNHMIVRALRGGAHRYETVEPELGRRLARSPTAGVTIQQELPDSPS